jgi:hypothetical protein
MEAGASVARVGQGAEALPTREASSRKPPFCRRKKGGTLFSSSPTGKSADDLMPSIHFRPNPKIKIHHKRISPSVRSSTKNKDLSLELPPPLRRSTLLASSRIQR